MEQPKEPELPAPRKSFLAHLFESLVVFLVSTLALTLVLGALVQIGARHVVEEFAKEADTAYEQMRPSAIFGRFLGHVTVTPPECIKRSSWSQFQNCKREHQPRAETAFVMAFLSLLGDMFAESVPRAVIDLTQIVAGLLVAIMIARRWPFIVQSIIGPAVIALMTVVFASVLSVPMLWIMRTGAHTVEHILPESAGVPFAGGSWAGFLYLFSARSAEGAMHHGISRWVERIFGRI